MQYLKPNVCKQMKAMGLVSESGRTWVEILEKGLVSNWHLITDEFETPNEHAFVIGDLVGEIVPAFTISDILLNADNAKLLWGEEKVDEYGLNKEIRSGTDLPGAWGYHHDGWHFFVHDLLDLHLSGTDIEPELQKAIESKPL